MQENTINGYIFLANYGSNGAQPLTEVSIQDIYYHECLKITFQSSSKKESPNNFRNVNLEQL